MRIQLINREGAHLIGFAKGKYRELDQSRAQLGRSTMEAVYRISAFRIEVKVTAIANAGLIRITSTVGNPQILLTEGSSFTDYNYYTDLLGTAPIAETSGVLEGLYNRRCQVDDTYQLTFLAGWTSNALPANSRNYIGGINAYEMAFFNTNDKIFGRIVDEVGQVATIIHPDILLPELSGAFGSLFGLYVYDSSTPWNLYRGAALYALNPNTAIISDAGRWIPNFFTAEPGDGLGLAPGWYYGNYPNSDYDLVTALDSLSVSLIGTMDTRYISGSFTKGWCEAVLEVNGVPKSDLNFFLSEWGIPVNVYVYHERIAGLPSDSLLTIGSSLGGREKDFFVPLNTPGVKPDKVEMWNLASFTNPDIHLTFDAVGVIIVEGTRCRGIRYKGFSLKFIDTNNYHSHAISRDGRIVAIFEGSGVITNVRVFDLFGSREDISKDTNDYQSGGFTEIQNSAVVAEVSALTGCIIPYRIPDFTPLVPSFPLDGATIVSERPLDYTDEMPSLSTLVFEINGTQGIAIKKVTSENGVDAFFGTSFDECFSSVVQVSDPILVSDTDKLISKWDVGGNLRGVVLGNFVGAHPTMQFFGTGGNINPWYGEVTLPPDITIQTNVDGSLALLNVAGEPIAGACIDEVNGEFFPAASCIEGVECGGSFTMVASSTCGQSGSLEYDASDPSPLTVTGDGDCNVGDIYSTGGGAGAVTFAFDSGSINSDTGEILSITGCGSPGEPRTGVVSATDDCGGSAQKIVRLFEGAWAVDEECAAFGSSRGYIFCDVFYSFELIDEGRMEVYLVRPQSDPIDCEDATPDGSGGFDTWDCCQCSPGTVFVEDMTSWSPLVPGLASPIPGEPFQVINTTTFAWECP